MSTKSTTASVVSDYTLGNDPDFTNCIYVLTTARGDGTPFDADSLLEEDIIKLCVGIRHVHPQCTTVNGNGIGHCILFQ